MSDIEDRLARGDLFAAAREEGEESRVLRRVLSGDLSRPEGLQARLDRLGARLPADAREGLSRVLSVLTAAEWFAALRKARQRRSKVEYVAAVEGTGAAVCGEIDCLWQDDAERWHVVEWVTTPVGDFGRQAAWEEAGPRLLAACKAWEAASGRKPWKVWLAFVYDGVFEDRPAGKVASKEVEGSLRTALRA